MISKIENFQRMKPKQVGDVVMMCRPNDDPAEMFNVVGTTNQLHLKPICKKNCLVIAGTVDVFFPR